MKKLVKISAIGIFGYLLSANVGATVVTCVDSGNIGAGGKNASSSIDYLSGTVSISNCGPFVGNDSGAGSNLTATTGGYGFDLSTDGGLDGGWVQLDKLDVLTGGDDIFLGTTGGGIITGTGWGGASGTFSFTGNGASEYLIALKFSNVFSTYLSDTAASGWGWNTDADGDGKYALSHLTVYVKGDLTKVPEPTSIALMGLGLLGMAAVRRRKQS